MTMKLIGGSLPDLSNIKRVSAEASRTPTTSSGAGCGVTRQPASSLTVVPPTDLATASDEAIVGELQRLLGSQLEGIWRDKVIDGQWDGYLVGYRCHGADPAHLGEVEAIIEAVTAPMDETEIAKELGKLVAATVTAKSYTDCEAWAEVMIDDLREFPAYAIRAACTYWRRNEKFLPTVSELVEDCRWRARPRLALRRITW